MALLAELLSTQYAFFAGISKEWRNAWGELPKVTQAITADTSASQLQWSFDGGLLKGRMLCCEIAEHYDVEVLRCAHLNGCSLFQDACYVAAAQGKLEMVQWAVPNSFDWRHVICDAAAAGSSLHILKWARANNFRWGRETCRLAASSGNLEVLQWARSENCPWGERTCTSAAGGGHLGVLQ